MRGVWMRIEAAFARMFPSGANPLAHLGAIAGLLLALLLISGTYLYIVFDTSVAGAWASIAALSRTQPFPGGWLRSLHRYAADAFLVIILLHLMREWALRRYLRFRRVSWLTGVPLLVFVYLSGIGGFWLTWDRLGQYSATASAELIDALPLIGASLSRNFVNASAVGDRLFSLLIFIHIGVPLLLVFGLWFHLQRISRPQLWPPRALALGIGSSLALLAALWPVASQAPADLSTAPTALGFDWILLHLHPLTDLSSPTLVWALIVGTLLLLLALPFRRAVPPPAVAQVDADNCNGCRRCVADCPYSAITLIAHPNGKPGRQLAVVDADRCASCGICAGACPSSTPFRSGLDLVTGIDMPQQTIGALRAQLQSALTPDRTIALQVHVAKEGHESVQQAQPRESLGARKLVIFGCQHGANVAALAGPDVISFSLLCLGQLPPSFIEYALRGGASAVVLSACSVDGCEFRLGSRWTAERVSGTREPRLRASVPRERLRIVYAGVGEESVVAAAVTDMHDQESAGSGR